MEKEPGQVLNDLKQQVSEFIGMKVELIKLNAYERIARIIAILSHSLLVTLLAFFATLFLFTALGFFLGELFNHTSVGFLIIALLYILAFIIVLRCQKSIQVKVMNIILKAMMDTEEETDKHPHEKEQQNTPQATDSPSETACGQEKASPAM